jgi:hypothetical protein
MKGTMRDSPGKSTDRQIPWLHIGLTVLAILACALFTRFGFLWASPDRTWPHSVCFEGDGPLWVRFAASLQRGEPFEFNLPIHTPGMAYLIAWTWSGRPAEGFVAQKTLLCILSSLNCVLIWIVARRLFNERVAILAGLLSAASFASTVQATSLNNETPYSFLLLIICIRTLTSARHRSIRGLLLLAVLNGVAVLFRAEHSLCFAMLCVYLVWHWRRGDRTGHRPGETGASRSKLAGSADSSKTLRRDQGPDVPITRRRPGVAIGLTILIVGFFLIPLPWNLRSHRAIQEFNTVEPRPLNYAAARVPWTPQAIEYIRALPAFAREGNFLLLTDLAASRGRPEVSRQFVEDWFKNEAGYVPRPLSPCSFVSIQGPLSFALANNDLSEGGFSTKLLDPQRAAKLALGAPRHLHLFQEGYAIGLQYLTGHIGDAIHLMGKKLGIFGSGLTQGLTPLNVPLSVEGPRRPADQMGPLPGTGRAWTIAILALAAVGLCVCARRRAGGICVLLIAYKALVALAFYGYVREAVSILPFFLLLVAIGLDAVLFAPVLRRWPRAEKGQSPLFIAGVLATIIVAVFSATQNPRYDVSGSVDVTPFWGPGAFESQQPLIIRQNK